MDFELRQITTEEGALIKLQYRIKEYYPDVYDPYVNVYRWSDWTDVNSITMMELTIEELQRIRDEG